MFTPLCQLIEPKLHLNLSFSTISPDIGMARSLPAQNVAVARNPSRQIHRVNPIYPLVHFVQLNDIQFYVSARFSPSLSGIPASSRTHFLLRSAARSRPYPDTVRQRSMLSFQAISHSTPRRRSDSRVPFCV